MTEIMSSHVGILYIITCLPASHADDFSSEENAELHETENNLSMASQNQSRVKPHIHKTNSGTTGHSGKGQTMPPITAA